MECCENEAREQRRAGGEKEEEEGVESWGMNKG